MELLTVTTAPRQTGPRSNGNEEALYTLQISRPGVSPPDVVNDICRTPLLVEVLYLCKRYCQSILSRTDNNDTVWRSKGDVKNVLRIHFIFYKVSFFASFSLKIIYWFKIKSRFLYKINRYKREITIQTEIGLICIYLGWLGTRPQGIISQWQLSPLDHW